jgi:hypothetical protein
MNSISRIITSRRCILFLATVGLAGLFSLSDVSLALQNDPIFKKCLCVCRDPAGAGEILDGISNTAGVACGAYDGKPCSITNVDGSTSGGHTMGCIGDKAGGTRATIAPSLGQNAPVLQQTPTTPGGMRAPTTGTILRRGIEGEQPAEPTPGTPSSPDQPIGTK